MATPQRETIGFRGEKFVELRLTDLRPTSHALFRPAFLGETWPAIDFYVELATQDGLRPYFFAQVKSTAAALSLTTEGLRVSGTRLDIARLLQIPGPTYPFAVHEPSERVFIRSVHRGMPIRAITRFPLARELTDAALLQLYDEVHRFWSTTRHKPDSSEFT
jgi:hypothetical protein